MQSSEQEKITQNEINSFVGLIKFIDSAHPENYGVEDFCFKASDLFTGLDGFVYGRFKCDFGISYLQSIFNDAIKAKPHMADKYFYVYSELMKLLITIYNAEPFISRFSGIFERLSEKSEFFESAFNQGGASLS